MLFYDDVITERQAKAGALAGWFAGEERIEHLLHHLRRDTGAVVANPNLHFVAEIPGGGKKHRLIVALHFRAALSGGMEAIRDQVQQHTRDLLRIEVNLTGIRIKGPLK